MTILDRLLGRPAPVKAVYGGPYLAALQSGPLLSSLINDPQQRCAAYLRAYRVGWFHKAGRKIADDVSALDWSVSDGDSEEGDQQSTLQRPDLRTPFESLSPIDQFQRLLERPNPSYTGRQLLRKTQVRLDFAGAAAWFLEGGDFGLPSAIYGISPARMWPSVDRQGNLIGWVMDKDTQNPVPFSANEILWFQTGNANDDELWGTSVVESVYSQVPITDLMARHTANVLTTGGRLAGMVWPKDRALGPDEYEDAKRAWRNVANDPEAGKRMLIFPEPMEYSQGAATPAEIGIPELAILNRDEILTAFPISPYRLGVPIPGGLNSGEVRREDRRDYWEGTIHPRADLLEETIQVGLLSKYEDATGQAFDFEIEEPNLDDAPSIIEKVGAYKGLVSVGFDPKESVSAVGLERIKWLGLPDMLDPAKQLQMQQDAAQAKQDALTATAGGGNARDQSQTAVAVAKSAKDRQAVIEPAVVDGRRDLETFFIDQRTRITRKLRDALPQTKAARKADTGEWWDAEDEDRLLTETLRGLYLKVGTGGLQLVADQIGRTVLSHSVRAVLNDLLTYGGARITQINETTRQAIVAQLAEGTRRGYSIQQLIEGVPAENYAGVTGAVLDNGTPAFDPYRAEVIARTETALSFNRSSLTGYDQFGVKEVQAIDGDGDEQCAERDGRTFLVGDALGIEDHPNGTLDWVPVI